jgi:hypothetical protein
MPTPALPLTDLVQQINRHETELASLRQEYESRQARLADLTRRKDELQDQLRQLEGEIEAVSRGGGAEKGTASPEPAAPATPPPVAGSSPAPTLRDLLVELVRDAGGQPVTVKKLAAEVARRKFPTTSRNIPGLIQTTVSGLVRKGVFRRPGGQPGVVLGRPETGKTARAHKPAAKRKGGGKGKAKASTAKGKPGKVPGQPPLREVITDILGKSRQPQGSGQLAQLILATGYKTHSKDFASVVSVALTKMTNLERIPGQGYRLKQARG